MIAPDTTTPCPVATAGGSFVATTADRTALLLLAVVSAALQLPFLRRGISFYDEGSILAIADALHRGELLYRDRATPTAPLTYELLAGLFDLFGPHLLVGRILQATVFVLCVLAVYAILRHFMGVRAACLGALALLPLKTLAFPFWTVVNYSQVAMLFWLATTAALLQYLGSGRWRWAIAAGCGIGLTVVTKQNLGGALAVACAGTLFLDAVRRDDGRLRSLLVGSAALVGCSLLPVLGFGAYYASCGTLDAVIARAVVGLLHLVQPYGVPLPWRYGDTDAGHLIFTYFPTPLAHLSWQGRLNVFAPWFFLPVGQLVKVLYFAPVLAFVVGSGCATREWWTGAPRRDWSGRVLVLALGAAAYASMLYRADWTHLMNVAPPLLLVCVVFAHRLTVGRRSGRWVVGALWALWMALGGLAGWAVVAVYQVPVHTPRGDLLVPRAEAEDTERVLAYLASRPATERILVLRAEPLYYFLSGRAIPGEFDLVMPGLLGPDDDAHLARDLPAVDAILYNPKRFLTVPSLITEYAPATSGAMVAQFEPTAALSPTAVVFSRRASQRTTTQIVRDLWPAPQEGTLTAERTSWMTYRVLAQTVTERGVERCVAIRHDVGPAERLVVTPMLHPVTWVERMGEPDRVADAGPAVFRISAVRPDGDLDTLFEERRQPGLPEPAVQLPLARYAGVAIALHLCVSLPQDLPAGPAIAPAGWAEPQIVRDTPRE